MTNELTISDLQAPAGARRDRASIQRGALAAARAHAIAPLAMRERDDHGRRRFDFDAALLALIFAGQFAVAGIGLADVVGSVDEPHVARTGTVSVASAPGQPAP